MVEGGKPDGALTFYSTLNDPTLVAKDTIYITMTIVADSFVTYRLYVVWNHTWYIVVLPIILLLATAGERAWRSSLYDQTNVVRCSRRLWRVRRDWYG